MISWICLQIKIYMKNKLPRFVHSKNLNTDMYFLYKLKVDYAIDSSIMSETI